MNAINRPTKGGQMMHALRTLLVSGFAYIVNYGITLVLTPYITKTVGTDAYGFVTIAKDFSQYATIVTTALNTYAARYIGLEYHKNNEKQANIYYSSVFWGNIALAFFIFVLALIGIIFLDSLLVIPARLITDVKMLFLFVFISFSVITVFSVFDCVGYVCNRMDLLGIFKTISYVADALVLVIAYILFPAKIYYVGLGTLAAALIVGVSDWFISRKYMPNLRVRRKDFSFSAVKRLVVEGFWASFNQVGNMLNSGLDLLVCNKMLTSLAMGQLAIAKTLHNIMQGIYFIVDQAVIPMFLKSYAEGNKKKLLGQLKFSTKLSGLLANLVFAGFVALGVSFYELWIPGQDIQLIYRLTIVTILTVIPNGAIHPLYYIYTLTVKKKLPCLITVTGGVVNVVSMYFLIKYAHMGVFAVAWTTVFVMSFINFVSNPLYMAHVLQLPWHTFYPDILKNVISCGVLSAVFWGLSQLYTPQGWLTLVLCAGVCVLIGTPLHLMVVCNKQQKSMLKEMIRARI